MKEKLSAGLSGASERLKSVVGGNEDDGDKQNDDHGNERVTDVVESIDVGVSAKLAYDQWVEFSEYEIVDEAPHERIIWRAEDGRHIVDGAVTFHEIGPRLTRVMLVQEHRAQGLAGRAADLGRAHRKRARQELAGYQHQVMARNVLRGEEQAPKPKSKRKRTKSAK